MKDERLLERLTRIEHEPEARFDHVDRETRMASIRGHLQRLLNTRQGNAAINLQYGLPDLTDLPSTMSGERVREIQQAIREVVQHCEPRLTAVQVHLTTEEGETIGGLRFQVTGRLAEWDDPTPAVFETLVEGSGHISVSG